MRHIPLNILVGGQSAAARERPEELFFVARRSSLCKRVLVRSVPFWWSVEKNNGKKASVYLDRCIDLAEEEVGGVEAYGTRE